MKVKMRGLNLLLIGVLALSVTGCGNVLNSGETKVYTLDIDGNPVFMDEDNEEVKQVNEVIEEFISFAAVGDYRNPDGRSAQEYYTRETRERNIANNVPERIEESLVANQQIIVLHKIEMENMRFVKLGGTEGCFARYIYITTIENATEEYFEATQLEKGVMYKRTMELQMVKEEGEWKVETFSASAREKVE